MALPSIFGAFSLKSHTNSVLQDTRVLGITCLRVRWDMEFWIKHENYFVFHHVHRCTAHEPGASLLPLQRSFHLSNKAGMRNSLLERIWGKILEFLLKKDRFSSIRCSRIKQSKLHKRQDIMQAQWHPNASRHFDDLLLALGNPNANCVIFSTSWRQMMKTEWIKKLGEVVFVAA